MPFSIIHIFLASGNAYRRTRDILRPTSNKAMQSQCASFVHKVFPIATKFGVYR